MPSESRHLSRFTSRLLKPFEHTGALCAVDQLQRLANGLSISQPTDSSRVFVPKRICVRTMIITDSRPLPWYVDVSPQPKERPITMFRLNHGPRFDYREQEYQRVKDSPS